MLSARCASIRGWPKRRRSCSHGCCGRTRIMPAHGSGWKPHCVPARDGKAENVPLQVSTADFKKGLRIVFDGQPYAIVDFQHVKPGKGGAFVRTKLKHMRLGKVIDNTFRAGEKVDLVGYDEKHMQFLYTDDRYHFMDTE